MNTPKLQLALDHLNLELALTTLKQVEPYVDLVEAGTPLVKAEGLKTILPALAQCTRKPLVADLKTADVAAYEFEFAKQFGASYMTMLGSSPRENIQEGVEFAQNYGVNVVVDMLGVDNYVEKAIELVKQGVEYLGLHCGISEQMAGKTIFQKTQEVSQAISGLGGQIVVAGGINADNMTKLKGIENIAIVIVGGSITKSPQPADSAKQLQATIREVF